MPVLTVHAKDDPYDAAQRAAGRIPGARLVGIEHGGHLLLGDRVDVGREVTAFLAGQGAP